MVMVPCHPLGRLSWDARSSFKNTPNVQNVLGKSNPRCQMAVVLLLTYVLYVVVAYLNTLIYNFFNFCNESQYQHRVVRTYFYILHSFFFLDQKKGPAFVQQVFWIEIFILSYIYRNFDRPWDFAWDSF